MTPEALIAYFKVHLKNIYSSYIIFLYIDPLGSLTCNMLFNCDISRGAGTGGAEGAAAPPVFSVGNCKLLWIKKIYRL